MDGRLLRLVERLVAEAEIIVRAHELRVARERLLEPDDRGCVLAGVILDPSQPVPIGSLLGSRRGQSIELRPGPVAATEPNVRQREREPQIVVERPDRFSLFQRDGDIERLAVQEEDPSEQHQQIARRRTALDLGGEQPFGSWPVSRPDGGLDLCAPNRVERPGTDER